MQTSLGFSCDSSIETYKLPLTKSIGFSFLSNGNQLQFLDWCSVDPSNSRYSNIYFIRKTVFFVEKNLAGAKFNAHNSGVSLRTGSTALWVILFVNLEISLLAIDLILLDMNLKVVRLIFFNNTEIWLKNTSIQRRSHLIVSSAVSNRLGQVRFFVFWGFHLWPFLNILGSKRNRVIKVALLHIHAWRPLNFLSLAAIVKFELLWNMYVVMTVF